MQNAIIYPAAHIVLDLETLSTKPNAVIISIGAVALSAQGLIIAEYHQAITREGQRGRDIDIDTLAWWYQQGDDARAASLWATDAIPAGEALQGFAGWVHECANPRTVKVWGNGSSFDNVIMSSLYADHREGPKCPWSYWNDRDMRTLLDQHPHARDVGPFEGIKHHALHDARHEAKQLAKVLQAPVLEGTAVDALPPLADHSAYALIDSMGWDLDDKEKDDMLALLRALIEHQGRAT